MAGIGEYVHANRINYLSRGLQRSGIHPPESVNTIYKIQTQQIKEEAKRTRFDELKEDQRTRMEQWLNMFFHPGIQGNLKSGELPQQTIANVQQAIIAYVKQHFKGSVVLNPKNLSVVSSDIFDVTKASAEALEAVNNFNSLKEADRRYVERLMARIDALINLRDNVGRQNFQDVSVWNKLQQLEQDRLQLEKDVQAYLTQSKNKRLKGMSGGTIITKFLSSDSNNQRLDRKIDELIRLLHTNTASNITGAYGELVLKATNYVANVKANASVQDILNYLETLLKNTSKSNKGVSGSAISYYANWYADGSALRNRKGRIMDYHKLQGDQFTVNMTEDKVDAILDMGKGLQGIKASIKNYNLAAHDNLTLLTGRNLLALVQDYPIFVNHFLNIVGVHRDDDFMDSDVALMHSAMKISAFLKALAGGVVTKQGRNAAADIFVVNDNSQATGYYKVYFLSDLLNNVINDINLMTIDDYPDGIWLQNRWAGVEPDWTQAAIRITTMVNIMRTMHLHISISKNALT